MKAIEKGFTLIELVVVIVILGILSAVALPKFIDLKSSGQQAVIEAVTGAIRSSSSLVANKARIDEIDDGSIVVVGNNVAIDKGYASGHWNNAWRYLLDIGKEIGYTPRNQVCSVNDLCGVGNQNSAPGLPFTPSPSNSRGLMLIWPNGFRLADLCYAYYFNPKTGDAPQVGAVIDGC